MGQAQARQLEEMQAMFTFMVVFWFVVGNAIFWGFFFCIFYLMRKYALWYIKVEQVLDEIEILKKKRCRQNYQHDETQKFVEQTKKIISKQKDLCQKSFNQIKKIREEKKQSDLKTSSKIEQITKRTGKIESIIKHFKFNRVKRPKLQQKKSKISTSQETLKYL